MNVYKRPRQSIATVLTMVCLATVVAGLPHTKVCQAQTPLPAEANTNEDLWQKLIDDSNKSCRNYYVEVAKAARNEMKAYRDRARLQRFTEEVLSFSQMLQFGSDLLGLSSTTAADRVRSEFKRHVLDPVWLVNQWKEAAERYQQEFRRFDVQLFRDLGISEENAKQLLPDSKLDAAEWSKAFERVMDEAMKAAQKEVVRQIGIFGSSAVASDAIVNGTRGSFANNTKEGSVADFFAKALVDLAISAVAAAMTDPTDEVVINLEKQLIEAEKTLLDGPNGFITQLEEVMESHNRSREEVLRHIKAELESSGQGGITK